MSTNRIICLCFLAALGGCGPKGTATFPVTGIVTYNGDPVEGAAVMFTSVSNDGPKATGETNAEGKFSLTTYVGPKQILKGAIPDQYKVAIIKAPPSEIPQMAADMDVSNPEYQKKSMERMIKMAGPIPGADSRANTGPAPPKKTTVLPEKYASPNTSDLKITVVTGQNDFIEFKLVD